MKQAATLNFLFNFYRSSSHELPFTVRTDCSHSHFLSRDCTYRSKRVHEIAMMQMFRIFLFNERKKILTIFNLPSKKNIYIYNFQLQQQRKKITTIARIFEIKHHQSENSLARYFHSHDPQFPINISD